MQGNGETEKPKQHTDEEAVGSRLSKPEQQLGMSLRKTRLTTAKFCEALTIPLAVGWCVICLLYTSPSPRDKRQYRMPSSA